MPSTQKLKRQPSLRTNDDGRKRKKLTICWANQNKYNDKVDLKAPLCVLLTEFREIASHSRSLDSCETDRQQGELLATKARRAQTSQLHAKPTHLEPLLGHRSQTQIDFREHHFS